MYTMPMSTASSATPMANPNSANNGYYDLVPSIQSPVEWFDSSCGAITARLRTIIVLANITKNETVYSDSCRSCNSSLGPARICALSPSDLMCVCVCVYSLDCAPGIHQSAPLPQLLRFSGGNDGPSWINGLHHSSNWTEDISHREKGITLFDTVSTILSWVNGFNHRGEKAPTALDSARTARPYENPTVFSIG